MTRPGGVFMVFLAQRRRGAERATKGAKFFWGGVAHLRDPPASHVGGGQSPFAWALNLTSALRHSKVSGAALIILTTFASPRAKKT